MNTNQEKIDLLEQEKQENETEIASLVGKIDANLYNINSSEFQISEYQNMNSSYEAQINVLRADNLLLDSMIEDYGNEPQTKAN